MEPEITVKLSRDEATYLQSVLYHRNESSTRLFKLQSKLRTALDTSEGEAGQQTPESGDRSLYTAVEAEICRLERWGEDADDYEGGHVGDAETLGNKRACWATAERLRAILKEHGPEIGEGGTMDPVRESAWNLCCWIQTHEDDVPAVIASGGRGLQSALEATFTDPANETRRDNAANPEALEAERLAFQLKAADVALADLEARADALGQAVEHTIELLDIETGLLPNALATYRQGEG